MRCLSFPGSPNRQDGNNPNIGPSEACVGFRVAIQPLSLPCRVVSVILRANSVLHSKASDWIEDVCRAERIECKYTRTSGYLYPVEDSWKHNKTLEKELEVCPNPCTALILVATTFG